MNTRNDDNLDVLIGALRREEASGAAPAHVEAAVMRAWDVSHAQRGGDARRIAARVASLAAAAVLTVGLTMLGGRLRSGTAVAPSLVSETAPTVILTGAPVLDGEQIRVVRMRIPVSTLHSLGVRSTASSEALDVDVVVGEDGVARALSLNP
jgi:hypothetical protein